MAIPSVNLFANQPGGGAVTALNGLNALSNSMNLEKVSRAKAKYAEQVTLADIMSKMAYANLIGLQPAGKILANENAFLSLNDKQKNELIQTFRNASMRNHAGNSLNQIPVSNAVNSSDPFPEWVKNTFKGFLGGGNKQESNPINAINIPQDSPTAANNALQTSPISQVEPTNTQPQDNLPDESEENKYYQEWFKTPEGMAEIAKEEKGNFPSGEEIIKWGRSRPRNGNNLEIEVKKGQGKPPTFAETVGQQKGIIKQSEKLGDIRAESQKELDQDYQQALQLKQPFQKLNKIIMTPSFQKARQLPGFQKLQLNIKSKIGTEEEQKIIGEFQAAARNVVAATVKGFGGRILASEIPLSESMKLGDDDTIGVMIGKAPVIEEFNEMILRRSRLASKLIEKYHISKGDALEQADEMIDGEAVRQQVANELKPKPTEEDFIHMMQKYGISKEEVKKRLKARGVL